MATRSRWSARRHVRSNGWRLAGGGIFSWRAPTARCWRARAGSWSSDWMCPRTVVSSVLRWIGTPSACF